MPLNKYVETFSHSDAEHRPFLGVSVDCQENKSHRPVGIIRVLRKSGTKPFVKTDAVLLQRLGREIHSLFLNWQTGHRASRQNQSLMCGARFPFSVRVVGQSPTLMKVAAIDRLGREFPAGAIWNRRQVESVLVDLMEIYRKEGIHSEDSQKKALRGGLIVNFRLARPPRADSSFRIFACHRILSPDPPSPEDIKEHEDPDRSAIGKLALKYTLPITFDKEKCGDLFRPLPPESKEVRSGLCMPMRFFSPSGETRGVVSIDCDNMELSDWRSEHLEVVALAARQSNSSGEIIASRTKQFTIAKLGSKGLSYS